MAGHDAEDLAQETFVKAWRLGGSFRGEGSYPGWLLRIGWRLFLDQRRGHKPIETLEPDVLSAAASDGPDRRIDVERALAGLGPRERAAALLCLGEGYSHAEAAVILDLPLGTLKSIVARARAQLAAVLLPMETD